MQRGGSGHRSGSGHGTARRDVTAPGWPTPYRVRVSEITETRPGWLSREDLESARERLPLVYVDAVPVRVDERGVVVSVGLLLRAMPDGSISRAPVSGRVMYG